MPADAPSPVEEAWVAPVGIEAPRRLGVGTLMLFLCGHHQAIWCVARAKQGWLLGAVFVLSASLAREYDRSDLTAEPYHLLLPFVASIITAILLYWFLSLFGSAKGTGPLPKLREFLQCFWATAPLAWIYAIPVERWLNAADSVAANFWLLGIVAAWRVILAIRIFQTLFGADFRSAAAIIFAFGNAVLILMLMYSPVPILDIMSGNRLSPAEHVIQDVHLGITVAAWVSIPVLCAGLWLAGQAAKWRPVSREIEAQTPVVTRGTWILGFCTIGIGTGLCFMEQPKWRRSTLVRNLIAAEDYQTALDLLSSMTRYDFPPHWELPPNPNYAYHVEEPRRLVRFFVAALKNPHSADWVKQGLQEKVIRGFTAAYLGDQMVRALPDDDLEKLVSTLEATHASGQKFPHSFHGIPQIDEKEDPHRAELTRRLEAIYQTE